MVVLVVWWCMGKYGAYDRIVLHMGYGVVGGAFQGAAVHKELCYRSSRCLVREVRMVGLMLHDVTTLL